MNAAVPLADPWRFQPNVEVYLLVAFLIGAYVYAIRVIGPKAVQPGHQVVSKRELWCFVLAMLVLFSASTWPIHSIGEDYLYSMHMVQHLMLSHFLPPLVLLSTPEWLLRLLVGSGTTYRTVRFLTRAVVAAVIYNGVVMLLHVPGVVNTAPTNGFLHYGLHVLVVLSATLMWMPIVSPMREIQISPAGKMVYLFLLGVVPTVPASWLAMADKPVYSHYGNQPVRVWGISAMDDQQIAGLIMKAGTGYFLWTVIIVVYVTRFGRDSGENTYRRGGRMPAAEITGNDEKTLTYRDVTEAFDRSDAPAEQPPTQAP